MEKDSCSDEEKKAEKKKKEVEKEKKKQSKKQIGVKTGATIATAAVIGLQTCDEISSDITSYIHRPNSSKTDDDERMDSGSPLAKSKEIRKKVEQQIGCNVI